VCSKCHILVYVTLPAVKSQIFASITDTMPWHILRLQMEEMASTYEGQFWIYWKSSHRQLTRVGPLIWRLGRRLTTPHHKKLTMLQRASDLDGFFAGSCEHSNEPLGSVKGRVFLHQLSSHQVLKMDPAPWSYNVLHSTWFSFSRPIMKSLILILTVLYFLL